MSKATEDFKKMMESDRGERAIYESAAKEKLEGRTEPNVPLPITRLGFESIVGLACGFLDLVVTGPIRNTAVGFFHSLGRTESQTSISALASAIHNTLSNHVTYTIDQEIKAEANKELAEEREKARLAVEELEKQRKIEAAQEKRAKKAAKKGSKNVSVGEQANEAGA